MSDKSLISQLYLLAEPPYAPESIIKAYRGLSPRLRGNGVPWHLTVPEKAYRAIQRDQEIYQKELDSLDLSYLNNIYIPTESLFDYLCPAKINQQRYDQYVALDTTGHASSFAPNNKGYAAKVHYDRTSTITGRLKTTSGPMLLHLSKVYRNLLESRFNGGVIISLDYKSLEPRVLLACCGTLPIEREGGRDIYGNIKTQLFQDNPKVTRDAVKRIVLAELYGAGVDTIKDKLRGVEDISATINEIRNYFQLDQLKSKLYSEWVNNSGKYITNFYGRRVRTDTPHTLVNHYIQSTAVDVAMLGFKNLLEYVEQLGRLEDIVPLFVQHDALILDINPNAFSLINGLAKVGGTDIKGLESTTFFMSVDKGFTKETL